MLENLNNINVNTHLEAMLNVLRCAAPSQPNATKYLTDIGLCLSRFPSAVPSCLISKDVLDKYLGLNESERVSRTDKAGAYDWMSFALLNHK